MPLKAEGTDRHTHTQPSTLRVYAYGEGVQAMSVEFGEVATAIRGIRERACGPAWADGALRTA
jgi:hypothetical protein